METKAHIKEQMLKKRLEMQKEQWEQASRLIHRALFSMPVYKNAKQIFTYIDYKNEVETRAIVQKSLENHKKVGVPKIKSCNMEFYEICSLDDLAPGTFGTMEPMKEKLLAPKETLIIVPGLAFDLKLHRIGYGGGYYDRYLKNHPDCQTAAVAFDFQVVSAIPFEDHDVSPELLITEKKVYS